VACDLNLNGNQSLRGFIRAKIFEVTIERAACEACRAEQRGIWVPTEVTIEKAVCEACRAEERGIWLPTQHFLWDQGKPRRTLIELAVRRTFGMQTDF
jgi:hypothetical protein